MFHKLILLVASVALVVGVGCGSTKSELIEVEEIAFTKLASGTHSNFTQTTQLTIRSQEELQSVYDTINSTRKPGLPVPEIDFSRQTVFFYGVGELSYGGPPVKIARVEKSEKQVRVIPEKNQVDPSEPVTTVMSSPFVLISFKKQSLPIILAHDNK